MNPREQGKQRHQKKINRNLKGLLSKCYKYGRLSGVELALYIEYPDKDEFVVFESEGYNCDGKIAEKVCLTRRPKASVKSKIYKPGDIEDMLNMLHKKKAQKAQKVQKVQKPGPDQRKTPIRKRTSDHSRKSVLDLSEKITRLGQFPKIPDLRIRA
ncbi:uncharacterized protein PpBr36_10448 [Pyricularia pennisetigena]|uniref:uncharacterized protein n=1 Tax=Pyricularia pennisetigena TaxID=1578925 RepID=UPI001151ACB6|nr:uncharacterized protein PpBr36_10448 [Pyricularia pennisetigena]TLS21288.1 hypothetical protein PpBr36_10448 [Pyricularia pennisetigena]